MYPDPHIRRRKREDPQTKPVMLASFLTRYKLTLRALTCLPFRESLSHVTVKIVMLIPPFRIGRAIKIAELLSIDLLYTFMQKTKFKRSVYIF